jgi:plastocyanin
MFDLEKIWKNLLIVKGPDAVHGLNLLDRNRTGVIHTRGAGLLIMLVATLLFAGAVAVFTSPPASAQAPTSATSVNISIKGFAFNPASITIVIGVNNTVVWTNNDAVTHTVTAADNSYGGTLSPHSTFTHTYAAPGVYNYHCSIHTYMKGSVIVLAGPATSTTTTTTTASSTAAVPELPFSAVAVVVITALVLASYVAVRRTKRVELR